jgi:hypothetical protein
VIIDGGIPASRLRAVTALVCLGIAVDLALHGAGTFTVAVAGLLSVACVLVPASPAPLLLIGLAAAVLTSSGAGAFGFGVLVLIPLVHLLHLCCAITAVLPRGARIAPAAFRSPLRRYAVTQLSVTMIVLIAMIVPEGPTPPILEVAALLSIAGMALAVIVLDRSRPPSRDESHPAEMA